MTILRVITENGSAMPLTALCQDEEHAAKIFEAWLAGLELTKRPLTFKVEIGPADR